MREHGGLAAAVEKSFGLIAARALRWCFAIYLCGWLATWVEIVAFLGWSWHLWRDAHPAPTAAAICLLLVFLAWTGMASMRTNTRLALFTLKLTLAVIVACLIRIREDLPEAWAAIGGPGDELTFGRFGEFLVLFGPVVFFAAQFAGMARTRREAAWIGIAGLALPLGVVCLAGTVFVQAAVIRFPSMASLACIVLPFWASDAHRFIPVKSAIAALTVFGAIRVGLRMLDDFLPAIPNHRFLPLSACCVGVGILSASRLELWPYLPWWSAAIVAAAAAISADRLSPPPRQTRGIDPVAGIAWVSGLTAAFTLFGVDGPLDYARIPRAYVFTFAVCLAGRRIQTKLQ